MKNDQDKFYILVSASLTCFMTAFMISSINLALPEIGIEFNMDAVSLNWISTIYLLFAAITLVPSGRLADLYGRKKLFIFGIVIFSAASLISTFSNSASLLIFSRALKGIGGGMIYSTTIAIVTSVFPLNERGNAIGYTVAAAYLGLSVGPLLGGVLTQNFGWRSIFVLSVLLGVITYIITTQIKGEWAEARGEKMDYLGTIIYALSFSLAIYGLSIIPSIKGLGFILAGIIFALVFIYWQFKFKNPLLNIEVFRNNRCFSFSNISALLHYTSTFAITFLLSLYLQYIKDLDPQKAGLILIFQPLVMTIFSPYAGKLSDRIEPRIVSTIGMFITFIGLLIFTFIEKNISIIFIVLNLALIGFGYAIFSSPNMNSIMSSVEKKYYGIASAILGTMRTIGQMISMTITMIVFTLIIGRVEITPDLYLTFLSAVRTSFLIFAILAFFGIIVSYNRGNIRKVRKIII